MRRLRLGLAVVALTAACTHPAPAPEPSASTSSVSPSDHVDPAKIKRIRGDLPSGYEIADVTGQATPASLWGLGAGWTAEPPQCGVLANPVPDAGAAAGLSGSGSGGILYTVVLSTAAVVDPPAAALMAECAHWTLAYGRSTANAELIGAPQIDGVVTVGVGTALRTVVESGTETDTQAFTYSAYLGQHVAFVTLITEPGSPLPPLPPQFAADLLAATVSALRG